MEAVKQKSWFRQLFPETREEYIRTIPYYSGWIWSNNKNEYEAVVYKKIEVESKKTLSIYCTIPNHGRVYFDINAWEKDGKLIRI